MLNHKLIGPQAFLDQVCDEIDQRRLIESARRLGRSLSKAKKEWTTEGPGSVSTVLWMVLVTVVAKLRQLSSSCGSATHFSALAPEILNALAGMPTVKGDEIDLRSTVEEVILFIITSLPTQDHERAARECIRLDLSVECILSATFETATRHRGSQAPVDFLSALVRVSSDEYAVAVARTMLLKCSQAPTLCRVVIDVMEVRPVLALLLAEDIERLCRAKEHTNFTHLMLESIRLISRATNRLDRSLARKIQCAAVMETDACSRALAWKTVVATLGLISKSECKSTISLARDAVLQEESKVVGAAILKAHVAGLKIIDTCFINDTYASLGEALLLNVAMSKNKYPASWIQDTKKILVHSFPLISCDIVMRCFRIADHAGRGLISSAFNQYLNTIGPSAGEVAIHHIVQNFSETSSDVIESFVSDLAVQSADKVNEVPIAIASIYKIALASLRGWGGGHIDPVMMTKIIIVTALMSFQPTPKQDAGVLQVASFTILKMFSSLANPVEKKRKSSQALIAIRSLRRTTQFHRNQNQADFERSLSEMLAELAMTPAIQRDTIKLVYCLAKPQEQAYYCLVQCQEGAFDCSDTLQVFLSLLGTIARENAEYLTRSGGSESVAHTVDSHVNDCEVDDYMDGYKTSRNQKHVIKEAKETSICDGLLSAYLPLLESLLSSSSSDPSVEGAALWTLGEFMKLSSTTTDRFFAMVMDVISDSNRTMVVRKIAVDVWAGLQPSMRPSHEKESGTHIVYATLRRPETSIEFATHLLKRVQVMILSGQLRDDRLHDLSIFLMRPCPALSRLVGGFFRHLMQKRNSSTVSSMIYEIYFALTEVVSSEPLATRAASKLVEMALQLGISVDALQLSLIRELRSRDRSFRAVRFLVDFASLAKTAIGLLLESIDGSTMRFLRM